MTGIVEGDSGWIPSIDVRFGADFERKVIFFKVPDDAKELEVFWEDAPGTERRVIRLWPDGSCTFYCNLKNSAPQNKI